jgi:hypothetical protein
MYFHLFIPMGYPSVAFEALVNAPRHRLHGSDNFGVRNFQQRSSDSCAKLCYVFWWMRAVVDFSLYLSPDIFDRV